jgi:hypothetical protein
MASHEASSGSQKVATAASQTAANPALHNTCVQASAQTAAGPRLTDRRLTVSLQDIADTATDLLVVAIVVAAVIWASKR